MNHDQQYGVILGLLALAIIGILFSCTGCQTTRGVFCDIERLCQDVQNNISAQEDQIVCKSALLQAEQTCIFEKGMKMKPNHCTADSCKDCMYVVECRQAERGTNQKFRTCYKCSQRTDSLTQILCPTCRGHQVFGETLNIRKIG